MNDAIIAAHTAWQKAKDNLPANEWATVRRLWRAFSDECRAAGLKPVEVAHTLIPIDSLVINLNTRS